VFRSSRHYFSRDTSTARSEAQNGITSLWKVVVCYPTEQAARDSSTNHSYLRIGLLPAQERIQQCRLKSFGPTSTAATQAQLLLPRRPIWLNFALFENIVIRR